MMEPVRAAKTCTWVISDDMRAVSPHGTVLRPGCGRNRTICGLPARTEPVCAHFVGDIRRFAGSQPARNRFAPRMWAESDDMRAARARARELPPHRAQSPQPIPKPDSSLRAQGINESSLFVLKPPNPRRVKLGCRFSPFAMLSEHNLVRAAFIEQLI